MSGWSKLRKQLQGLKEQTELTAVKESRLTALLSRSYVAMWQSRNSGQWRTDLVDTGRLRSAFANPSSYRYTTSKGKIRIEINPGLPYYEALRERGYSFHLPASVHAQIASIIGNS